MKYVLHAIIPVIIMFITPSPLMSEQRYSIKGTITAPGKGSVYIFLVDQEHFKKPMTGIKVLIQTADSTGAIPFFFSDVQKGAYGIRCFQDTNGNGKLDGGLFGPKEPWGMSWKDEKVSGWPKFQDIAFSVPGTNVNIKIDLQ